jgi:integration host factor subunit beta
MTRSELIARLATQFQQLTAKDADLSVKAILEGMSESLVRGDRIEIRGFGTFALNYRPARSGRNPSTGETVSVPAKRVPHFTPGKELRERVQAQHDVQQRAS